MFVCDYFRFKYSQEHEEFQVRVVCAKIVYELETDLS